MLENNCPNPRRTRIAGQGHEKTTFEDRFLATCFASRQMRLDLLPLFFCQFDVVSFRDRKTPLMAVLPEVTTERKVTASRFKMGSTVSPPRASFGRGRDGPCWPPPAQTPYVQHYRIRLLLRMLGVEAVVGMRVQDRRAGNR